MRHAIPLIVFLQAPTAVLAQENIFGCLAPKTPDVALPAEALLMYRHELTVEFEHYFSDVSKYITCIDAERASVLDEARVATDACEKLLRMATDDEIR